MQVCAYMRRWPRQEGGGADGYTSFSSLSFLFYTTTCQVDRERSARVCASGLIDVGSAEALCVCERLVCVEKADVRNFCSLFRKVFVGKERSAEAVVGSGWKFCVEVF
jgi:hypothetical protein